MSVTWAQGSARLPWTCLGRKDSGMNTVGGRGTERDEVGLCCLLESGRSSRETSRAVCEKSQESFYLSCIGVPLVCDVGLISALQQSDSVYIYTVQFSHSFVSNPL